MSGYQPSGAELVLDKTARLEIISKRRNVLLQNLKTWTGDRGKFIRWRCSMVRLTLKCISLPYLSLSKFVSMLHSKTCLYELVLTYLTSRAFRSLYDSQLRHQRNRDLTFPTDNFS